MSGITTGCMQTAAESEIKKLLVASNSCVDHGQLYAGSEYWFADERLGNQGVERFRDKIITQVTFLMVSPLKNQCGYYDYDSAIKA